MNEHLLCQPARMIAKIASDRAKPDGLLEVVIATGLQIEFLHEFPFCAWPACPP